MPKNNFSYKISIRIFDNEKFFGAGVAQLLEHVDNTQSLLQASKKMNMAYTKSLKIIKRAEDALGYKLLIKKSGGKSGGGSYLTDNAHVLLRLYRQFEKNISSFADNKFSILQNEMDKLK